MIVEVTAPTRIDLAGATLDIDPLSRLLDRACTVNVAIDLMARVRFSVTDGRYQLISQDQKTEVAGNYEEVCQSDKLPLMGLALKTLWDKKLPGLQIACRAESPKGAGIGGSSALAVALCLGLRKMRAYFGDDIPYLDERALIRLAKDIETDLIKVPAGCQDHWGALRGGINIINFPQGGETIETFPVRQLALLEEELLLCYSGDSRHSGINNWEIFKKCFDGHGKSLEILEKMAIKAQELAMSVRSGDWNGVLRASTEEWELRKFLWPGIETEKTRKFSEAAHEAGAKLARVCGAGGGGVMAIFADKKDRLAVSEAMRQAGGQLLAAGPSFMGAEIMSSSD